MENNLDKCSGGALGPIETWKQRLRDSSVNWTGGRGFRERLVSAKEAAREKAFEVKEKARHKISGGEDNDYSHIYRKKTWLELVRVSASVMGIEFCYAAETAYVSPTLLQIGVPHRYMTMIWCCSPVLGFFLTPLLGSLSDGCTSNLGRRRPFIMSLAVGAILGLVLVPNGVYIGEAFGEDYNHMRTSSKAKLWTEDSNNTETQYWSRGGVETIAAKEDVMAAWPGDGQDGDGGIGAMREPENGSHFWGLLFTIAGVILIDFCSDAAQSPARTYMLDVTTPEDQPKGLSTFTIMAGLGGSLGYLMGGVKWKETFLSELFRNDVQCLFALVLIIELVCVFVTLTSFAEVPLPLLLSKSPEQLGKTDETGASVAVYQTFDQSAPEGHQVINKVYPEGALEMRTSAAYPDQQWPGEQSYQHPEMGQEVGNLEGEALTLQHYLASILHMPKSLMTICLTNFFSWSSLVCYSLFFTDFVAETVFEGNPASPEGTPEKEAYHDGVRFGCYGMSLYSLSCSIYSMVIVRLVSKFRAKKVYVCGQLVYSVGMVILAATRNKAASIIFSASAGIMYSTLFTMPYMLIAHYHATGQFVAEGYKSTATLQARGLGTDLAIVSSMIFIAQFLLNLYMGPLMTGCGTIVVIIAASILAFLGAISALFVTYFDL